VQEERSGDDVEIPAQQVDARKRKVFGADHQRHEKVPEHSGHNWN